MIRFAASALLLALAVPGAAGAAPPSPAAQGKPGTPAWAGCVWRLGSESAKNWLAMKAPAWVNDVPTPAETLGHRLIALCSSDAANERKPNRTPNWGSLRAALTRARPASPGASDSSEPVTLLCRNHVVQAGRETLFRIDIVRVSGTQRTTIFQQHFGEHQGRIFRVPQDIRHIPAADAEISTVCRSITSTGGLADA